MATTDRTLLKQQIAHPVKVSRTAIWLMYEGVEEAIWQSQLLDILTALEITQVQAQTAPDENPI